MRLRFIPLVLLLQLSWTGPGLAQLTFPPVALAFPQIAFGGDADGQNYVTIVQIVNNNSASTTGKVTLYSDGGSQLAARFNGEAPQSTKDIMLAPGETRQLELTLEGSVTAGWMHVSYTPSEALTSVIIQFRSGTMLLSEVGVEPAFGTLAQTDFAAETGPVLNTGIALANPSNATGYTLAVLWDGATGAPVAGTVISLAPNGHISRLLTELFPSATNIEQTRAKISLDSCLSQSCNVAGGNGFLATAIRLNADQFTTIPVTARLEGGDRVRILPQVAFGGPAAGINMKTVLYFTTNVSSGVFGTAEIFDDAGSALAASADGGPAATSMTFTVLGNRVSRIVLSGDQTLRSGWIRLTLSGTVHLIASAVFQTFSGAALLSEASVLDSPPIDRGLVYVKTDSAGANVGLALANPESSSNTVTLDLFNKEGFLSATRDVALAANGHLARFVTEIFPELASAADFEGALSIRSETPFSVLALRLIAGKVASLPVAGDGMYRPSITALRITTTQRTPAQVNFEIDVNDFDSDIATASSSMVTANAAVDFGTAGFVSGEVTMDGTSVLDRPGGTLKGSFQPPVTGSVPSGFQAALYIVMYDALGNASNLAVLPFRF